MPSPPPSVPWPGTPATSSIAVAGHDGEVASATALTIRSPTHSPPDGRRPGTTPVPWSGPAPGRQEEPEQAAERAKVAASTADTAHLQQPAGQGGDSGPSVSAPLVATPTAAFARSRSLSGTIRDGGRDAGGTPGRRRPAARPDQIARATAANRAITTTRAPWTARRRPSPPPVQPVGHRPGERAQSAPGRSRRPAAAPPRPGPARSWRPRAS